MFWSIFTAVVVPPITKLYLGHVMFGDMGQRIGGPRGVLFVRGLHVSERWGAKWTGCVRSSEALRLHKFGENGERLSTLALRLFFGWFLLRLRGVVELGAYGSELSGCVGGVGGGRRVAVGVVCRAAQLSAHGGLQRQAAGGAAGGFPLLPDLRVGEWHHAFHAVPHARVRSQGVQLQAAVHPVGLWWRRQQARVHGAGGRPGAGASHLPGSAVRGHALGILVCEDERRNQACVQAWRCLVPGQHEGLSRGQQATALLWRCGRQTLPADDCAVVAQTRSQ